MLQSTLTYGLSSFLTWRWFGIVQRFKEILCFHFQNQGVVAAVAVVLAVVHVMVAALAMVVALVTVAAAQATATAWAASAWESAMAHAMARASVCDRGTATACHGTCTAHTDTSTATTTTRTRVTIETILKKVRQNLVHLLYGAMCNDMSDYYWSLIFWFYCRCKILIVYWSSKACVNFRCYNWHLQCCVLSSSAM